MVTIEHVQITLSQTIIVILVMLTHGQVKLEIDYSKLLNPGIFTPGFSKYIATFLNSV